MLKRYLLRLVLYLLLLVLPLLVWDMVLTVRSSLWIRRILLRSQLQPMIFRFRDCQFVANFLSIATVFSITTAKNFSLQNCSFTDTDSTHTFLSVVTTDATANHADGLTIQNCVWEGSTNTTATAMVTIGAALDLCTIADNFISLGVLNTSGACMTGSFTPTNVQILRNFIIRLNTAMSAGLALDTSAVTSGLVMGNSCPDWCGYNYVSGMGN